MFQGNNDVCGQVVTDFKSCLKHTIGIDSVLSTRWSSTHCRFKCAATMYAAATFSDYVYVELLFCFKKWNAHSVLQNEHTWLYFILWIKRNNVHDMHIHIGCYLGLFILIWTVLR